MELFHSEGVPRLINTIGDNALFEGFLAEAKPIDVDVIQAVVEQLGLRPDGLQRREPVRGNASRSAASHDAPAPQGLIDPFGTDDSAFDALGWNDTHPGNVAPAVPEPELW